MVVRYDVDADTLGLAKVLAALRIDVTYPGDPGATITRRKRPPCPVTSTSVPDDEWIPIQLEIVMCSGVNTGSGTGIRLVGRSVGSRAMGPATVLRWA